MFSSKRERSGAELLPKPAEAFAERLDMLATTVSSTAAALARTDGEIAGLRRELGNGLARIEELVAEMRSRARSSDVRELEKKVTALAFESARTSETKRLDEMNSKVAVLGQRVDTLSSTVASAAGSVAGRDGEIASLRRALGEGARGGPTVDDALLRRVDDVASASASASLRLESHAARLAELASGIDSVDVRVSDLAQRIDAYEHERTALAASVAEAAGVRWRELERALAAIVDRLDAVEERGAAVSSELSRVTSLWPAALRSLEARVEELASTDRSGAVGRPQLTEDSLPFVARPLERQADGADETARDEPEAAQKGPEPLTEHLDPRLEPASLGGKLLPFSGTDG